MMSEGMFSHSATQLLNKILRKYCVLSYLTQVVLNPDIPRFANRAVTDIITLNIQSHVSLVYHTHPKYLDTLPYLF